MSPSASYNMPINHDIEVGRQIDIISNALTNDSRFEYLSDIGIDAQRVVNDLSELGDRIIGDKPSLSKRDLVGVLHEAVKQSFDDQLNATFFPTTGDNPRNKSDEIFYHNHAGKYQEALLKNTLSKNSEDSVYLFDDASKKSVLMELSEQEVDYFLESIKPYSEVFQQRVVNNIHAKRQWSDQGFEGVIDTANETAIEFAATLDRVGLPSEHLKQDLFPDYKAVNAERPYPLDGADDLMQYVRNTQVFHDANLDFNHLERDLSELYEDAAYHHQSISRREMTDFLHNGLDAMIAAQLEEHNDLAAYGLSKSDIQHGLQQVAMAHYDNLQTPYGQQKEKFSVINPIYNPLDTSPLPHHLSKDDYEILAGTIASYPQGSQQSMASELNKFDYSQPYFHYSALVSALEDHNKDFENKALKSYGDLAKAATGIEFSEAIEANAAKQRSVAAPILPASAQAVTTGVAPASQASEVQAMPVSSNEKEVDFELNHENIQSPDHLTHTAYSFAKVFHSDTKPYSIAMTADEAHKTLKRFVEGGPNELPSDISPRLRDNILLDQLEKKAEQVEIAAIANQSIARPNNSIDGQQFLDMVANGKRPLGVFFDEVAKQNFKSDYLSLGYTNHSDNTVNPYPFTSSLTEKEHLSAIVAMKDTLTAGERQSALSSLKDNPYEATTFKDAIKVACDGIKQIDDVVSGFDNQARTTQASDVFEQAVTANKARLSKAELRQATRNIEFSGMGLIRGASYDIHSDLAAAKYMSENDVSHQTQDLFKGIAKGQEQLLSDIRSIRTDDATDMQANRVIDDANQLVDDISRFTKVVDSNISIDRDIKTLIAYKAASSEVSKMLDDIERSVADKGLDASDRMLAFNLDKAQESKDSLSRIEVDIHTMAMHKQGINLPKDEPKIDVANNTPTRKPAP